MNDSNMIPIRQRAVTAESDQWVDRYARVTKLLCKKIMKYLQMPAGSFRILILPKKGCVTPFFVLQSSDFLFWLLYVFYVAFKFQISLN